MPAPSLQRALMEDVPVNKIMILLKRFPSYMSHSTPFPLSTVRPIYFLSEQSGSTLRSENLSQLEPFAQNHSYK